MIRSKLCTGNLNDCYSSHAGITWILTHKKWDQIYHILKEHLDPCIQFDHHKRIILIKKKFLQSNQTKSSQLMSLILF